MNKSFIILLLVLINTVLIILYIMMPAGGGNTAGYTGGPAFDIETLQKTLMGVLRANKVEEYNVRERTVSPGGRSEIRVAVPPGISLTNLNLEIHRAARAMGYTVSAREDIRTGHLSIHIRDGDTIVLTVIVVRQ